MTRIDRQTWNRVFGATFVALVVGSGILPAIQGGTDGRQPPAELRRRAELTSMGAALAAFGGGVWSDFAKRFTDDPAGAGNARLVLVPLSLANVEINRYELSKSKDADALARALGRLEFVVAQETAWSARAGSGGSAAYLALSVLRLARECDVGDQNDRIEGLRLSAERILRSEASARLSDGASFGGGAEALADSAAVFAAAAALLDPSDDSAAWELACRDLARRALANCPSPESVLFVTEGALSYVLAGRPIPKELSRVPPLSLVGSRGCGSRVGWSTQETVSADGGELDEATAAVLAESRALTLTLIEHFLWIYPPGSSCSGGS